MALTETQIRNTINNIDTKTPLARWIGVIKTILLELNSGKQNKDLAANRLLSQPVFGPINGVNTTFTTGGPFYNGTEEVFLNGQRLKLIEDYTAPNDHTIVLASAPGVGEEVAINYTPK